MPAFSSTGGKFEGESGGGVNYWVFALTVTLAVAGGVILASMPPTYF